MRSRCYGRASSASGRLKPTGGLAGRRPAKEPVGWEYLRVPREFLAQPALPPRYQPDQAQPGNHFDINLRLRNLAGTLGSNGLARVIDLPRSVRTTPSGRSTSHLRSPLRPVTKACAPSFPRNTYFGPIVKVPKNRNIKTVCRRIRVNPIGYLRLGFNWKEEQFKIEERYHGTQAGD
jgi:hypothetical protein